uniref:Uncharacterized protein n=1 Tax=Ciona savignyi TaxID=51511 RepID=H2Z3V8_CIOSA
MSNIKKLLGRKPNSDKNSPNGAASSTPPTDEYSVLNGGNPPYCECDEHSKHGDDRNHGDHILYCEHQECFSSAPLWWVRGEDGGEFCHIVPADAKRQTPVAPACGADATP